MELLLEHGLVPGVGGQPWAIPVMEGGVEVLMLLSFATRVEAFYLALERGHRETNTVYKTLCAGLMDMVIFGTAERPIPEDVQLFLSEEHNNWHGGAKSNAIQQLSWVHEAEQQWLQYAEQKNTPDEGYRLAARTHTRSWPGSMSDSRGPIGSFRCFAT